MDNEFELLEFQFPSIFPIGTYVKVVKVVPHPGRTLRGNMIGKLGIVNGHRTRHGQRWNRVSMDAGLIDFVTCELQKHD